MTVWDVDAGASCEVPVNEAAQGMLRYARRLGAGSAERAEVERQALAMLPPVQRKTARKSE